MSRQGQKHNRRRVKRHDESVCMRPYRAKDGAELDRNIEYAQALTRRALKAGLAPITPHLYITQCLDEKKPQERAQGLATGMELLKGCDFMIVGDHYDGYVTGDRNSKGVAYSRDK